MKRTVLIFGTFDGVHAGHRDMLRQARELGERIVVVVARDATVKTVKERLPVRNENKRLQAIRNEPLVTEARLGSLGDKYAAIIEIEPDVIALGYDQMSFTQGLEKFLKERLPNTTIVRLQAFHPEKYKSSFLNNQL
jgi:cytidyltransferase-like protein